MLKLLGLVFDDCGLQACYSCPVTLRPRRSAGYHLTGFSGGMPTRWSRSISGIWAGKSYSLSHPFLPALYGGSHSSVEPW